MSKVAFAVAFLVAMMLSALAGPKKTPATKSPWDGSYRETSAGGDAGLIKCPERVDVVNGKARVLILWSEEVGPPAIEIGERVVDVDRDGKIRPQTFKVEPKLMAGKHSTSLRDVQRIKTVIVSGRFEGEASQRGTGRVGQIRVEAPGVHDPDEDINYACEVSLAGNDFKVNNSCMAAGTPCYKSSRCCGQCVGYDESKYGKASRGVCN